ncbi:uncharacterized protein E0L32_003495 [Thyridium curvatum]|uniref:Uncharacterized protein n=1 Tax=Thyridium curvatum TaxID=1093900 RepID=A0A507BBQ5_9PEZI|nr:uncharacterized protein E0L32_003495 [Thyridium curvatum]TPX16933.1 hypothetical protein E0L32_003495 [Thyridium curvatum]
MSSIVNKIKEAVHSDSHSTSQPEGTHGPHSSRAANAADPRVDSDRDHRAAPGGTFGGQTGGHTTGAGNNYTHSTGTTGMTGTHAHTGVGTTGMTGTHGAGTTTTGYNDPEGVHGPHSSRMANAADPRVDSDRDHRAAPGGTFGGQTGGYTTGGNTHSMGTTAPHAHTGVGTTGMTGTHGAGTTTTGYNDPEGVHGPHSSRMANAADPRVDSDRDHRAAPGSTVGGQTGAYTTGGNTHSTGTTGMTGTHAHTGAGTTGMTGGAYSTGPGPAPNTAGPHKSDMLNKMDPRVDSNLDGSKTMGGNKTYQSGSTLHKDPTDASQVPPSVMQKHVGGPTIEHEDHSHDRARRNSQATHQENFSGI